MILVYDFETTGIPDYKAPSSAPHQPHIVSVAAVLMDNLFTVMDTYTATVRPDGWTIPAEAAAVHGIDTERATATGIPEPDAVAALYDLSRHAVSRLGFNESFDARIMRIALKRYAPHHADIWKAQDARCVMRACHPFTKLKQAGSNRPKVPKLSEAVRILLGREHVDAHDAMADVRATIDLHRHLSTRTAPTKTPQKFTESSTSTFVTP